MEGQKKTRIHLNFSLIVIELINLRNARCKNKIKIFKPLIAY